MDNLAFNELKSLCEYYEKIKWRKEKDIKIPILYVEDFIENARINIIPSFKNEHDKISAQILECEFNNFISQEIAESLIASINKLLPIYYKAISQIVDPKCESINDLMIKTMQEILDIFIFITGAFIPSEEIVPNVQKIFDESKFKLSNKRRTFVSLDNKLNQFEKLEKLAKMRSKISMSFSLIKTHPGQIIFSLILILIITYVLCPENEIQTLNNVLKLIGWFILLLWIPFWFSRTLKIQYNRIILPLIAFASVSMILSYGIMTGMGLIILLLGYPLWKILSIDSRYIGRINSNAKRTLYFPMLVSLSLVFLGTREPLWLAGLLIWIIWTNILKINYKYFRPTFDNISKQDKEKGELIEDPLMFAALAFSCIMIIINALFSTSDQFLINLYIASAEISLTLVGFLFAVQGILSSKSLNSQNKKEKNREIKIVLKLMEGLKGFMLAFLSLFIVSILGAFSIKSVITDELGLNIAWLMNPINFNLESIPVVLKIAVFICFITVLSLNIAYLHYFFLLGDLLVLPLKLSLSSEPALIETVSASDKSIEGQISKAIYGDSALNGRVFRNITINNIEAGLQAACEMEEAFPNKSEMMNLANTLGHLLIYVQNFSRISLWVRSNQGSLELKKVFQVDLNKEKLDFINNDNGLDLEYKFIQIGAFFWLPAYEEAQLM